MMIDRLNMKLLDEKTKREVMILSGMCSTDVTYRVAVAELSIINDILHLIKEYYIEDEADEDGR